MQAQGLRGVNLSGAEWGANTIPGRLGREYTFHSERSYQYWTAKGLGLVRFAFLWERLQPVPGGPLDADYLALLKQTARWAEAAGAKLIIEPHNFGRYRMEEDGRLVEYIIDNPAADGSIRVSKENFADLWARLAQEFRDDAGVHAFDLMNEPHDMARADWKAISQEAVNAIRGMGDKRLILVPGNGWSGAEQWLRNNGPEAWIQDPENNFAYEAHCYFDRDNSGAYARGYDEEAAYLADLPNIGRRRVLNFVEWCRRNQVRGYVGEFGAPHGDARWLEVMENFLAVVDEAGMDATYWAAGEWWEEYQIGIQPRKTFTEDRPQVELLQRHLSAGWVSTNSLASGSGYQFAPSSLVLAKGVRLATETSDVGDGEWRQSLGGTMVELTDSHGAVHQASLRAVAPERLEYVLPAELAPGLVQVRIVSWDETVARGAFTAARVAPALFAGRAVLETPGEGARRQAVIHGTGFRNMLDRGGARLRAGTQALPLLEAGAVEGAPGLDLLRVELPAEVQAGGELVVALVVDGLVSNEIVVRIP